MAYGKSNGNVTDDVTDQGYDPNTVMVQYLENRRRCITI